MPDGSERRAKIPQLGVEAQPEPARAGTARRSSRRCRTWCRSAARPSARAGTATAPTSSRARPAPRPGPRAARTRPGRRLTASSARQPGLLGGRRRSRPWPAARGTRPTASARPAAARSRVPLVRRGRRQPATYAGSLAPDRNSISRNCTDWKPLAGASCARKARKSCGVIVSSTSTCSTSTRSIACAALQAHPGQVVLAGQHPVAGVAELVQQQLEPQLVDLVDGDEQQLVVGRRVGHRDLLVEQLGHAQVAAVGQPAALLAEPPVPGPRRGLARSAAAGKRRRCRPALVAGPTKRRVPPGTRAPLALRALALAQPRCG